MPPTSKKPKFDSKAFLAELADDLLKPEVISEEFTDGEMTEEEVQAIELATRELLKDRRSRVRFWRTLFKAGKKAAVLA